MFQTFIVQPIYNLFVAILGFMPHGDVGLAIITLTLVVRAVFYPAFAASIRTQLGMQKIQGEIDVINDKYKDNPTKRAEHTMALFREHKIRPFSSFLALLIQLPILFALYIALFKEGLPAIATNLLYSFVHAPTEVQMNFFGLLDLSRHHNLFLTALVAGLQFCVMWFSIARMKQAPKSTASDRAAREAALRTQQQLMLYFFPALMAVVTYSLPAAVGLYFAATNVISLGQELLIRRQGTV